MQNQLLNLDEVLHQAALQLDGSIAKMDEWLMSDNRGPMVERLERCVRCVHRKREHMRKALESNDQERILQSHLRLVEEILRFYHILGSVNKDAGRSTL